MLPCELISSLSTTLNVACWLISHNAQYSTNYTKPSHTCHFVFHLSRSFSFPPTLSHSLSCPPPSIAFFVSRQHCLAMSPHVEPRDRTSSHRPHSALSSPREGSLELRNQLSYNPQGPLSLVNHSVCCVLACRFAARR